MATTFETRLATTFARELLAEIGAGNLQVVRNRNASPYYAGCCASHDFCDANMVMAAAWIATAGREFDMDSDADVASWNAAWGIAKRDAFAV